MLLAKQLETVLRLLELLKPSYRVPSGQVPSNSCGGGELGMAGVVQVRVERSVRRRERDEDGGEQVLAFDV